jgi:hypothetical protein
MVGHAGISVTKNYLVIQTIQMTEKYASFGCQRKTQSRFKQQL